MDTSVVVKDQLHHFWHEHPLSLVHLQQPNHINKNVDDEDEDEDDGKDEFVEKEVHGGQCHMCNEQIYSFHLCYYYCKSCDYSWHKFCAELPMTQQNHPLHPGHDLTLSKAYQHYDSRHYQSTDIEWKCSVCNLMWKNTYNYHCSVCKINIDIVCATMSDQKIDHPSHPHQLERMSGNITSSCVACGNKHEGVFFQCTTCSTFRINLDCALLPTKLLIQNQTNGNFTHSHPLTLAYSFPYSEQKGKFYPLCRVCDGVLSVHLWIYKCDKCRYYAHVDCATSKREPFMSIILPARLGKTYKNFKDEEYPNLLNCPFHDEGDNLVKHHISNQKELIINKQHDGDILDHPGHQHPLVLFDKQISAGEKMVSLHDPMKKIQLLCDGCVKPIMTIPFYMCSLYASEQCSFVLHEWCAKLPSQVQDYAGHPEHTLFLIPKLPNKLFGVFKCVICQLPSNGFAYGCTMCGYYVDTNCAFIPKEITHDAHPNHLLTKVIPSAKLSKRHCCACNWWMKTILGFHCPSCDFYIHVHCALLLPRVIKHKCDKHPLTLRYTPAENHISEYFCEICEDEFDPWDWFYHCSTCAQSTHAACAPLICQYEQATYAKNRNCIYMFLNVKFGGSLEIKDHSHRLSFVQGLESDGECSRCDTMLQYNMIFKCLECKFAVDYDCASLLAS